MDMNEIKEIFFQECEEQLAELETGLLALNDGDQDPETVNAVFRAVHSIKGGAGAFALDELVAFAHVFETTLDCVRSNQLEPTRDVVKVLLKSADVLADLTNAARDGGSVDEDRCKVMIAEMEALANGDVPISEGPSEDAAAEPVPADHEEAGFEPVPVQLDDLDDGDEEPDFKPVPFSFDDFGADGGDQASGFRIRLKPKPGLYQKGNETLLLLRELSQLGTLDVSCDMSALPTVDEIDPEGSYLVWNATLSTGENEAAVRAVFEFAEWDCDIEITPLQAGAPPQPEETAGSASDEPLDASAPEQDGISQGGDDPDLEIQAADGPALTAEPADEQPETAPDTAPETANVIDLQQAAASQSKEDAGAAGQKALTPSAATGAQSTIRVELGRIDRLINLVGELVINQAMLAQSVAESATSGSSSVTMGLEDLQQLTREIQDSVMAIRAQPVKPIFQRMSRTVREAAEMVGKNVRLVTEGETTEVDKTVIDKLAEPLTHMIRNAVDHGLELPDDRVAAGKAPEGVVKLSAKHRSGRIVLEISDDGAGINRQKVRQKAIDNGLITAETALTDEEVDNLIFQPGFSTAEQLSDISGRGVGMDVVKRSIQALGGRVGITSTPGKGSVFTMSLPLTLAVLDGMVVTVADQTLVVPLTSIIETLKPENEHIHGFGASGQLISIRDSFKPLVDVGQILNFTSTPTDPLAGVALLVDSEDGGQSALLVDAIQGQRQVVIKSLEANYANVPGIAAATILGDGQVALIVDVEAVVAASRNGALKSETSLAAVG